MKILVVLMMLLMASCGDGQKTNNKVVENFELKRYLGTWYEIVRLDHSFEMGCSKVYANYSRKENGDIKVVNRCVKDGKEKSAKARAHFKNGDSSKGHLKVSFFWPFYGDYKIIYLDKEYRTAIVDGGTTDYFWILSRSKSISSAKLLDLLKRAEEFGFDSSKFIFTKQI